MDYAIEMLATVSIYNFRGLKAADAVLKKVPVIRTRQVVFALIASAYK